MGTWIALLRGINVVGNNILPMTQLRSDFESLKLKNVRTYIQSGNVVFDAPSTTASALATRIGACIEKQHGFRPQVLVLDRAQLLRAIESSPFPKAVSNPKSLHFFFLAEIPTSPNSKGLNDAKAPTESYLLVDRVFYLHAPDGLGRSKLAAKAEKLLGVAATARNYNTVENLISMATQSDL